RAVRPLLGHLAAGRIGGELLRPDSAAALHGLRLPGPALHLARSLGAARLSHSRPRTLPAGPQPRRRRCPNRGTDWHHSADSVAVDDAASVVNSARRIAFRSRTINDAGSVVYCVRNRNVCPSQRLIRAASVCGAAESKTCPVAPGNSSFGGSLSLIRT